MVERYNVALSIDADAEGLWVRASDYDAMAAELAIKTNDANIGWTAANAFQTELVETIKQRDAIKRTREQERDYANVCYENMQFKAALTRAQSVLAVIINAGLTFDGGVGGKFLAEIRGAEVQAREALRLPCASGAT